MKRVYMPSIQTLYQMQDMGSNIYRYLVIKNIESMICDGIGSLRGILSRYSLDSIVGMQEYLNIVKSICLLYPKELENLKDISEEGFAKDLELFKEDIEFCLQLLDRSQNGKQSNLDYLSYFSSNTTSNALIIKKALVLFKDELTKNPRYRFEYLSDSKNNTLLDDIIGGKIGDNELVLLRGNSRDEAVKALTIIEPSYAISLPDEYLCGYLNNNNARQMRINLLYNGMNALAYRYKIDKNIGCEYLGKDILTNPDSEVKRLIKNINNK